MYCWYVIGAIVLLAVVFLVIGCKMDWFGLSVSMAAVLCVTVFVSVAFIDFTTDRGYKEIDAFNRNKDIVSCIAPEHQDEYLIQQIRVDNNRWLKKVQERKERLGNWSFYDEEVLELTPIP